MFRHCIFVWAFLKVEQCWCDILLRPINVDINFCSVSEELDNVMHCSTWYESNKINKKFTGILGVFFVNGHKMC